MTDWPVSPLRIPTKVFNVEDPDFGAVSDDWYADGVANATTTFTSATANFAAGDAGKVIVIEKAANSVFRPHHTTIASVTNATTVELTNAAGRSQTSCRFYISRAGDQTTPIQAAIDACGDAGGGIVLFPGAGYLHSGLVKKNHVTVFGAGMKATFTHLNFPVNAPCFRNDYTSGNGAQFSGVRDMAVDGASARQTAPTTTLSAAYTAGNTTIDVTSAAGFLPSNMLLIGTNRLMYTSITLGGGTAGTDRLNGVVGGIEDTTDANAISGATVTHYPGHGIYHTTVPYANIPATADIHDPNHLLENVFIRYCKGDGVSIWSQSETRVRYVYTYGVDNIGFRPSFDTWHTDCTADGAGRIGFFIFGSSSQGANCKAFSCGTVDQTKGHGFLFEGPVSVEAGGKAYGPINAQDNFAHGIYLRKAQRVNLFGISDSNSVNGVGNFQGVCVDSSTNSMVNVVCVERKLDGVNSNQQNALKVLNSFSGSGTFCSGNQINITHGAASGATIGPAIAPGSDLTGSNDISINGANLSASPLSPLADTSTMAPNMSATVNRRYQLTTAAILTLGSGSILRVM